MKNYKNSERIIAEIEALLNELKLNLKITTKPSSKIGGGNRGRTFSGLPGEIFELIEDGFLDEPKTIGEIQKKLKDRGVQKPTTAIMPSLIHLIRKRIIERNKPDKGLYKYFKR